MNEYKNKRFGRLIAIEPVGRDRHRNVLWRCECDCGKESIVRAADLKRTKSCGCLSSELTANRNRTHGLGRTKLYLVWAAMKQRCCNPQNKRFADYGGRGITMCDEWQGYEPFAKWAVANGYKEGLEIDRIDNDSGYSPENCRFVTSRQNSRNKRDNLFLDFNGERKPLVEWAEIRGLPQKAVWKRLHRGWSIEDVLTLPIGTKRSALTPQELDSLKSRWGEAQPLGGDKGD